MGSETAGFFQNKFWSWKRF